MIRLLLLLLVLSLPAQAGQVAPLAFDSPTLGRSWPSLVYLPDGYGENHDRYPVVFLLHGANNDASGWVKQARIGGMVDHLIATHQIPPCLIVMPSVGNSWYLDGPEKIETGFIHDLVPWVDSHLRTEPGRSTRMIAGVSMGGFGALRLALHNPDLFAAVALLSPAIYVPVPPSVSNAWQAQVFRTAGKFDPKLWQSANYPALLDAFDAAHEPMRLFISAGAQDHLQTNVAARILAATWRNRGWPAQIHLENGAHDFILWRRTVPEALRFLLQPGTPVATSRR